LTTHRADLVADRTRTINRLPQQLIAVCPALERAAQLSSDRGWVVLLARYQAPESHSPKRCFAADPSPD
jgi:hypothetical protein